jgi:Fe-S cluster biogenesis protein NfuA
MIEAEKKAVDRSKLPADIQKIEEILDNTVRQFLQGDGGDIQVLKLEGHTLEVRYEGACGTCPSSTSATLDAIQGILQEQFDPEIQIIPVM